MASNGRSDDRLHTTRRLARLPKSSAETPNAAVSAAPSSDPMTPAPLKRDMSVANSTPSIPGGQSEAAKTRSGIKASWPSTAPPVGEAEDRGELGEPEWRRHQRQPEEHVADRHVPQPPAVGDGPREGRHRRAHLDSAQHLGAQAEPAVVGRVGHEIEESCFARRRRLPDEDEGGRKPDATLRDG
eukprot:scaffold4839_cov136-Isochrysis_galbana.AAC.6